MHYIIKYLKGVAFELRKMTWPTAQQLARSLPLVCLAIVVIGLICWPINLTYREVTTAFYNYFMRVD